MRALLDRLPPDPGQSALKRRYSGEMGRGYISNGCVRCGRRQGQHYEIHARYDEQVACSFPLQISEEWRSVIQAQYDGTEWWSVYPPGVLVE